MLPNFKSYSHISFFQVFFKDITVCVKLNLASLWICYVHISLNSVCSLVPGLTRMSLLSPAIMQKKVRDVWGLCVLFVLFLFCKKSPNELMSSYWDGHWQFYSDFLCSFGKTTESRGAAMKFAFNQNQQFICPMSCASYLSCVGTAKSKSPEQFKPVAHLNCHKFYLPLFVPSCPFSCAHNYIVSIAQWPRRWLE